MQKSESQATGRINNLVVISDTHCGCRVGLCPPTVSLDDGGIYRQSSLQRKMWAMWQEFWKWVEVATRGEPFAVVHNGDAIDGVHHGSTTQISQNLRDQAEIAFEILAPIVDLCGGRYYHIRGTEAHVGKSGVEEERLAKSLGALPNEYGQYARYDLWINLAGYLGHFLHHIGTTGSQSYEASAIGKELVEEFVEAGRWGGKIPDFIVRSHRHRAAEWKIPIQRANQTMETSTAICTVTPCWQGKTPFVWKVAGARLSLPQWGGVVIRVADGELFTRWRVWSPARTKTEHISNVRTDND